MRTVLVVVAVVCLPLFAADEDALGRAIKLFKSRAPAGRAEGSRLAEKEVRRLLAPLVEAMKDPDPEVRRRAREAILNLVPHHKREKPKPAQGNRALAQLAAQGAFRLQLQQQAGRVILAPQVFKAPQVNLNQWKWRLVQQAKDRKRIAALGVRGTFVHRLGVRTFRVDVVDRDSVAQKAGFRVGDCVWGVDGKPVRQPGHLDRKKGWSGVAVQLLRGNRIVIVKIP